MRYYCLLYMCKVMATHLLLSKKSRVFAFLYEHLLGCFVDVNWEVSSSSKYMCTGICDWYNNYMR